MDRRTYLRSLGIAGMAGVAGCLETVPGVGSSRTVLGPPEQDLSASTHPTHGDEFPSLSLPDPLLGEEVSTEGFEGERAFLLTFIYTNCHDDSCPMLLSRLAHAQHDAIDGGYADETAFLAMTFDPDRDTEDTLREEAEIQDVDLEAGNWHFLRPENFFEARDILDEKFGLTLRNEALEDHDHNETDDDGDDLEGEYDIVHYNLILLVNKDGIVERAYPNATSVEWSTISDDLGTVVEG
ncbi:SCO family protein [Natrialbaceae archaeon AArc-T1-2]|uniref:SCO family protein n=1 Tax=Natrialbaceae archaeon AArc-T1-2 TaxID=3053904 RepID=UPI00255AC1A0|nr:SCO family protein [Natrialbaceae archaeon AArc-T1-2]WIV67073.1 SCO family protein [Natrialbaceae archaeon AArc-T1-2]